MVDFLISKDGFLLVSEFNQKFKCHIRIDEPGGAMVTIDTDAGSFDLSKIKGADELSILLKKSIESGTNLIYERCKNSQITYGKDTVY